MLSDDEVVPDADEIKDFAYYAELAEEWLAEAESFTPQIFNPRKFDHAIMASDVYSRLAAAAAAVPAPALEESDSVESRMTYRHADGCPCVTN